MARTDIVDMGPDRIQSRGAGHKLTERTYLDASGKATTDLNQAVSVLGPAGRVIPAQIARDAGLVNEKTEEPKAREAQGTKIPGTPEADLEATEQKPKRRARTADKRRKTASEDK